MYMKIVQAHETESDAGISALLHIDPNDQPVVGKEAKLFFTFTDASGKFEIQRCDCVITLFQNDTQVDQRIVDVANTAFASVGSYPLYTRTFADAGVYKVELVGKPKDGATFGEFSLHYDVRVEEPGAMGTMEADHHTMMQQHLGHIIIFGVGLAAAIGLLIRNYYQTRTIKTINK